MDHRSFQQLAAADALDNAGLLERVTFAVHRRTCASCRALRDDLDRVTFDLGLVAPVRRPPVALHGSVMAAVRATVPGTPVAVEALATAGLPASAELQVLCRPDKNSRISLYLPTLRGG